MFAPGLRSDRDVGAVTPARSAIARPMPRDPPLMNRVLPRNDAVTLVSCYHALPTVSPDTRSPDQESGLGRGESHVLDFSRSTRSRKVNFCIFPEAVSGNVSAK